MNDMNVREAERHVGQIRDLLHQARLAFGPSTREVLVAASTRNLSPDQTQEGMRVRLEASAYQQLALEQLADLVAQLVATFK
jgi:hypothetical protein